MLAEERRFRIREMLSEQRTITASELCASLGVTAATIRRDLASLEHEGVLVRSHGGAVSQMSSTKFQPSYETLARSNSEEKKAIARAAEDLILDGDTVFLEGSTTVYELAARLQNRSRLTVVTNSPTIVCLCSAVPRLTCCVPAAICRRIRSIFRGSGHNVRCPKYVLIKLCWVSALLIRSMAYQLRITPKHRSRR
jgi:DeoR family fructose operon transcriptional repressor